MGKVIVVLTLAGTALLAWGLSSAHDTASVAGVVCLGVGILLNRLGGNS